MSAGTTVRKIDPTPPRVAIFVDRPDWHARRLASAFAARGVDARFVSMSDCAIETGAAGQQGHAGLMIPGFEAAAPEAVFVRCLPGGSFEQVTLRLGLLHALRAADSAGSWARSRPSRARPGGT